MTPQLAKIKGTPAQAVICWGTGRAPALVAKNMKQLEFKIPLIQSHGAASPKFIEGAGDAADGIILPAGKLVIYKNLPDSDPQKAVCRDYAEKYKARFKKPESQLRRLCLRRHGVAGPGPGKIRSRPGETPE